MAVVGASGFLGSSICAALTPHFNVVPVCRPASDLWRLRATSTDVPDPIEISGLRARNVDAVVVAAGGGSPQVVSRDAMAAVREELAMHDRIIDELALSRNPPVFVILGSRTQYGRLDQLPAQEGDVRRPQSLYAASKQHIETVYRVLAAQSRVRAVSLLLTNPYGPLEWVPGRTHGLVSLFLVQGLSDGRITVYGSGEELRDYLYVDDVSHAVRLAIGRLLDGSIENEVINIGSGTGTTIFELASQVSKALHLVKPGREISVQSVSPPGDSLAIESGDFIADIARAHTRLSWAPSVGLMQGIESLVHRDYARISQLLE